MPRGIKTIRNYWLALLVMLLAACGDLTKRWDPMAYTVRSGDTLYSIAWRYEMDYRDIAEWNNIDPPYEIYPGQRLAMQPVNRDGTAGSGQRPEMIPSDSESPPVMQPQVVSAPEPEPESIPLQRPTHIVVKKNDTLYSIARSTGYSHHQLARWNRLRSPYVLHPGQKLRLTPPGSSLGTQAIAEARPVTQPVTRPATNSSSQRANAREARPVRSTPRQEVSLPSTVNQWHWPVRGRVVSTYKSGDTARKGISISGRKGQPVSAAAAGTVVYSGNGLINYGNLVIIKHSHSFLSAYAHNKTLLVKEGDQVKSGQAIAKMGDTGDYKPSLHFEIRHNGKPVNPLKYLPRS